MLWKTLVGVLATLVLVEGAFIIFGRHPINKVQSSGGRRLRGVRHRNRTAL